jgi:hypothetical protein
MRILPPNGSIGCCGGVVAKRRQFMFQKRHIDFMQFHIG